MSQGHLKILEKVSLFVLYFAWLLTRVPDNKKVFSRCKSLVITKSVKGQELELFDLFNWPINVTNIWQ